MPRETRGDADNGEFADCMRGSSPGSSQPLMNLGRLFNTPSMAAPTGKVKVEDSKLRADTVQARGRETLKRAGLKETPHSSSSTPACVMVWALQKLAC